MTQVYTVACVLCKFLSDIMKTKQEVTQGLASMKVLSLYWEIIYLVQLFRRLSSSDIGSKLVP